MDCDDDMPKCAYTAQARGIYCRSCGYNLFGLEARRCPECGCAFDLERPETLGSTPWPNLWPRLITVDIMVVLITLAVLSWSRLTIGAYQRAEGRMILTGLSREREYHLWGETVPFYAGSTANLVSLLLSTFVLELRRRTACWVINLVVHVIAWWFLILGMAAVSFETFL